MRVETTIIVERDDEEVRVRVWGEYIPFVRGRHYLAGGDPGYPDEGGYVECMGTEDGIELTEEDWDMAAEKLQDEQ